MNDEIQKLQSIIDEEINGYENIEKLYIDKKEILMHGKGTDLYEIDSKIIDTYKNITNLSEARKEVTKSMDIPTFSITDIINKVKSQDEIAAKNFEAKKAKVNELAHKIFELEKVNMDLTKHGMYLTGKTIEAMLKGVSSANKEYNQKGQNIAKEQLEMSSIVEEA